MSPFALESIVYLLAAAATVAWSVWSYLAWTEYAGYRAGGGARYVFIVSPSTLFVLLLFSGWDAGSFLRLDLIGLAALIAVTVIAATALAVAILTTPGQAAAVRPTGEARRRRQRRYVRVMVMYHVLAIVVVAAVYVVRLFPPVLMAVGTWLEQGRRLTVGGIVWSGISPQQRGADVAVVLNRVMIAAISYLPLAVLRFVYQSRQLARMRRQVTALERRVVDLERRLQ